MSGDLLKSVLSVEKMIDHFPEEADEEYEDAAALLEMEESLAQQVRHFLAAKAKSGMGQRSRKFAKGVGKRKRSAAAAAKGGAAADAAGSSAADDAAANTQLAPGRNSKSDAHMFYWGLSSSRSFERDLYIVVYRLSAIVMSARTTRMLAREG